MRIGAHLSLRLLRERAQKVPNRTLEIQNLVISKAQTKELNGEPLAFYAYQLIWFSALNFGHLICAIFANHTSPGGLALRVAIERHLSIEWLAFGFLINICSSEWYICCCTKKYFFLKIIWYSSY